MAAKSPISARASARVPASAAPPRATVRAPRPIAVDKLPTPFCWGCTQNENAPLEFQVDLDLLAPLGDGLGNAALWFSEFAERTAGVTCRSGKGTGRSPRVGPGAAAAAALYLSGYSGIVSSRC